MKELYPEEERKLTEMCKLLFPRNVNEDPPCTNEVIIFNRHGEDYVIRGVDFRDFDETDEELSHVTLGYGRRVHWFEFCIKKLSKKLIDHIDIKELYEVEDTVDYLYKHFKLKYENNR